MSNLNLDDFFGGGAGWVWSERSRHLDLGYTIAHDADEHSVEELTRIGSCYINWAANGLEGSEGDIPPAFYPEDSSIPWKTPDSEVEGLVKGASFILAALDLFNAQMLASSVGDGPDE